MEKQDYLDANLEVAVIAGMIETLPLKEMIAVQGHTSALGPLLDPTGYMKKADDFSIDCRRTEILREAQIKLVNLREDFERRQARKRG